MGNNAAMNMFSRQVIALYDQGVLTLPVLDALAEPYRHTDIDLGGLDDELAAKDGKDFFQVVCETIDSQSQPTSDEDFPDDEPSWYCTYETLAVPRYEFC